MVVWVPMADMRHVWQSNNAYRYRDNRGSAGCLSITTSPSSEHDRDLFVHHNPDDATIMAATGPKNLYHRRLVAEASAKACWICYKPSSTVLITAEGSDDWFHICPGHLTDRKFAIPKDEEDPAKKKREEELEKEIEAIKKEYEEKQKKKAEKRKAKEKKDGKQPDEKADQKKEDEEDEKAKEEKVKALEEKKQGSDAKAGAVSGPRVFELQKNFWQMRMQKRRDADAARRNRERMRQPGLFPAVPGGNPGG